MPTLSKIVSTTRVVLGVFLSLVLVLLVVNAFLCPLMMSLLAEGFKIFWIKSVNVFKISVFQTKIETEPKKFGWFGSVQNNNSVRFCKKV